MKQRFKKRYFLLSVAIPALILVFLLLFAGLQSFRFHRLTGALFREEMAGDTLSMHYILAYPEDYGIPGDHPSLPLYSKEAQEQSFRQLEAYREALTHIHPLFLRKDDRLLYTLLTDYLKERGLEERFPYYAEPLSPASGIQSSLPVLLAEYTFRTKQDVENYLSLLTQIPAYLESIAQYEREKSQAGLFMSDAAADQVIDQCYRILDYKNLTDDTHFLNTTFAERLLPLTQEGLITEEERAGFVRKNHALLLDTVLPAYEALGDQILVLKGSKAEDTGLAALPEGKEYYALLLSQSTGSGRSVAEIQQLLTKRLKHDTEKLAQLLKKDHRPASLCLEMAFPHMTPQQCLQDLQSRITANFPPLPDTGETPSCTVKQVSPSLEDYASPAFYLTPPVDDITENSVYINGKDPMTGLELYTTLAHEGYPGHLYQTVYFQLGQQQKKADPARSLLHYGGYSEGWALYVEMESYSYAKQLLEENGASQDILSLVDALRLNRSIQLCLYSLLDLEIHYGGADVQKVSDFLSGFGITDAEIVQSIYEYIAEEPANYPKYYVAYLEFELLRDAAKEKWGEDYSDMRFHKMVLDMGPCPFPALWDCLEE